MSLDSAIDQYLAFLCGRRLSLGTIDKWRGILGEIRRLSTTEDPWPTFPDLVTWQASQVGCRTTVHHKVGVVKRFFKWAHDAGMIEADPAVQLEAPRRSKHLPKPLDDDMLEHLMNNWKPDYRPEDAELVVRDRLLVRTFIFTGLRRAEVCSLNVGDIDLQHGRIHVRGKGDRDRVVPIPAPLELGPLVEGRKSREPLFVGRRKKRRLDREAVSYIFTRKVSPAVGVRVTPHMLRHSYATYLCRRGVPLRQIQQLLGHSSLATTQLYLDVTAADLEQAVTVLDGLGSVREYGC
jgi:site-specific recombinase XerD